MAPLVFDKNVCHLISLHGFLVCTQVKVHQCEFIRVHSQPCPLIMWHCIVVDNRSVVGITAAILEMLESTLEHEVLHEGMSLT